MTTSKTFKRRVRERMAKTGESYMAARRHVLEAQARRNGDAAPPAAAKMQFSDEAIARRTGRTWDEWFALLDADGAAALAHPEIARRLRERYAISGWWAQSVTVGYERARGLRDVHQHANGYSITVSRTIAASPERVFAAFHDEDVRARWLPATLGLRTARPVKSLRFDWEDGTSRLHVYLTVKGEAKTQVSVEHERLADGAAAEAAKPQWRARLDALKALLEG